MVPTELTEQAPRGSAKAPVARASTPPAEPDQPRIDWTGRAPRSGSDDDGDQPRTLAAGGASGTRRLAMVAGVVSLAYIAWIVIDLAVLAVSGTAYLSLHEALGSLGARLVLCLAWLAILYHGLDGLRVVVTEFAPRLQAHERFARGVVAFVLLATWIPTSLVVIWPAVRRWFAS